MLRLTDIKLPLDHGASALKAAILKKLKLPADALLDFQVFKRAHDARNKQAITYIYTVDVTLKDETRAPRDLRPTPDMDYKFAAHAPAAFPNDHLNRPLVIGAGPCGLFAALILAQSGFRPIILERGKAVRERTKDTWGLWRRSVLNPESNVQFGEGGAGTFSDGKLYSQIKDPRYLSRKVLTEFVKAGAPEEILTEAHPHIGTFRLVTMVEAMRETIEALGGEYRFNSKVADLLLTPDHDVRGVKLESGEEIESDHVVLALGHSARDSFEMLHERGVAIEAKPFSIGFRIEHPQGLIDKARFGRSIPELGAADYKLVHHAKNGRDVYSFCMCPGGFIVAAATEPDAVVVNGMSPSARGSRFANSGLVVGVGPTDYGDGVLDGLDYQAAIEKAAFRAGGGHFRAPAQRVTDFLARRVSVDFPDCSYRPGLAPADLYSVLPPRISGPLADALRFFGERRMRGYVTSEAVLVGVESRSSAPLRIERDSETLQSPTHPGLYPAAEGAGYAGGIVSAALDGLRIAERLVL